jgi:hypothetical protein
MSLLYILILSSNLQLCLTDILLSSGFFPQTSIKLYSQELQTQETESEEEQKTWIWFSCEYSDWSFLWISTLLQATVGVGKLW